MFPYLSVAVYVVKKFSLNSHRRKKLVFSCGKLHYCLQRRTVLQPFMSHVNLCSIMNICKKAQYGTGKRSERPLAGCHGFRRRRRNNFLGVYTVDIGRPVNQCNRHLVTGLQLLLTLSFRARQTESIYGKQFVKDYFILIIDASDIEKMFLSPCSSTIVIRVYK